MNKIIKRFKTIARRLFFGYNITTYFFSQAGEDAALYGIFNHKLKNKIKGFYVDVGAYHPTKFSNTLLFYKEGWSGINIEARPGSKKIFDEKRSRDINIEVGVGPVESTMNYFFFGEDSSINTFSESELAILKNKEKIKKTIPVDVMPLSKILKENLPKKQSIDFLSIDVEGFDFEVLKSNDWNHYKPKVLLIEQKGLTFEDVLKHEITTYLKPLGYSPIAKTIIRDDISTVIYEMKE